jgi:hypothetical protein
MAQLRVDLALLMGKGPSGSDQKKKVGPKRDKKAGKILVFELLFRWASEHTHNVWGSKCLHQRNKDINVSHTH